MCVAFIFLSASSNYDRTVAKRKTLFDDRPVEISVRFVWNLLARAVSIQDYRNSHLSLSKTLPTSTSKLLPSNHMWSSAKVLRIHLRLKWLTSIIITLLWCCRASLQLRAWPLRMFWSLGLRYVCITASWANLLIFQFIVEYEGIQNPNRAVYVHYPDSREPATSFTYM